MKTIIITNYKAGLCSYLDDKKIKWTHVKDQVIRLYYDDPVQLFEIGFDFGCFYSNDKNY